VTPVSKVEFEFHALSGVRGALEEGVLLGCVLLRRLDQLDPLRVQLLDLLDLPAVHEALFIDAACPVHLPELPLVGGEDLSSHVALLGGLARGTAGEAVVGVGDVENHLVLVRALLFIRIGVLLESRQWVVVLCKSSRGRRSCRGGRGRSRS